MNFERSSISNNQTEASGVEELSLEEAVMEQFRAYRQLMEEKQPQQAKRQQLRAPKRKRKFEPSLLRQLQDRQLWRKKQGYQGLSFADPAPANSSSNSLRDFDCRGQSKAMTPIKLPRVCTNEPELWFIYFEAKFARSNIEDHALMYQAAINDCLKA